MSDGQEKALKLILLNYANDEDSSAYQTIQAISVVLGCDGQATLRDQFAMAALTALVAENPKEDRSFMAETAYFFADGMMEYRKP